MRQMPAWFLTTERNASRQHLCIVVAVFALLSCGDLLVRFELEVQVAAVPVQACSTSTLMYVKRDIWQKHRQV